MPDTNPPTQTHVSGRWIIPALLVAALLVFLAVWATLRWVEHRQPDTQPLNWHQRTDWPDRPVRWTTLAPQGMQLTADARWRELELTVSPEEEAVVLRAIELAERAIDTSSDTAFTDPAVRDELESLARRAPEAFYPRYLLGTWHRLAGDADAAGRHYADAFALAPAVITQTFLSPCPEPLPDRPLGTYAIVNARLVDEQLDQSLRLVYPRLETDARARIYLPVYDTVYAVDRLPQPPGHELAFRLESWFEFPDRLGTLPRATVQPRDDP